LLTAAKDLGSLEGGWKGGVQAGGLKIPNQNIFGGLPKYLQATITLRMRVI